MRGSVCLAWTLETPIGTTRGDGDVVVSSCPAGCLSSHQVYKVLVGCRERQSGWRKREEEEEVDVAKTPSLIATSRTSVLQSQTHLSLRTLTVIGSRTPKDHWIINPQGVGTQDSLTNAFSRGGRRTGGLFLSPAAQNRCREALLIVLRPTRLPFDLQVTSITAIETWHDPRTCDIYIYIEDHLS